jgi:hypothetical protein
MIKNNIILYNEIEYPLVFSTKIQTLFIAWNIDKSNILCPYCKSWVMINLELLRSPNRSIFFRHDPKRLTEMANTCPSYDKNKSKNIYSLKNLESRALSDKYYVSNINYLTNNWLYIFKYMSTYVWNTIKVFILHSGQKFNETIENILKTKLLYTEIDHSDFPRIILAYMSYFESDTWVWYSVYFHDKKTLFKEKNLRFFRESPDVFSDTIKQSFPQLTNSDKYFLSEEYASLFNNMPA